MSSHKSKEVAKFLCGVEAFHAFSHAYFWYSGTTLKVGPLEETPKWHRAGAIANALAAVALGIYGWSSAKPREPSVPTERQAAGVGSTVSEG